MLAIAHIYVVGCSISRYPFNHSSTARAHQAGFLRDLDSLTSYLRACYTPEQPQWRQWILNERPRFRTIYGNANAFSLRQVRRVARPGRHIAGGSGDSSNDIACLGLARSWTCAVQASPRAACSISRAVVRFRRRPGLLPARTSWEQRTYDAHGVHHTSGSKGRASETAWTGRRAHSVEVATVHTYTSDQGCLPGSETCSLVKRPKDDAINGLTPKSIATLRQR